jgi:hypothetical protein
VDYPHLSNITGAGSPALKISKQEAEQRYPVGPPYLAHARDFVKLADTWVRILPATNAAHPNPLAEMYALCIAAAHLKLPHTGKLVPSRMCTTACDCARTHTHAAW